MLTRGSGNLEVKMKNKKKNKTEIKSHLCESLPQIVIPVLVLSTFRNYFCQHGG